MFPVQISVFRRLSPWGSKSRLPRQCFINFFNLTLADNFVADAFSTCNGFDDIISVKAGRWINNPRIDIKFGRPSRL